jgi:hypothetical protein
MIKRHGRIASSMPIERFSMSATLTSPAGCAEHCVSSACKAPFEAAKHVREKSFKEELCKKSMKFTLFLTPLMETWRSKGERKHRETKKHTTEVGRAGRRMEDGNMMPMSNWKRWEKWFEQIDTRETALS